MKSIAAKKQRAAQAVQLSQRQEDETFLMAEQLSRSAAFFGAAGQQKVTSAFVIVVGAGSAGAAAAVMLCRSGTRRIRLIDGSAVRDPISHELAVAGDGGIPRVHVVARTLRAVRPDCEIDAVTSNPNAV